MRILIADSDVSLLSLVRRTLEAEGHQVRVASTTEALDVAASDGRLDVVLLDAQLARRAKASCTRVRDSGAHVFVTTPLSDGDESVRMLREWFNGADYLRKPFSVLDLPIEMEQVARKRGQSRPTGGVRASRLRGADLLGRMAARGAAGPARGLRPPVERGNRSLMPRAGGAVVFPVAERLAGAWLERFSGSIRIRSTESPVGRPLVLRDGGLVDSRDTSLVVVAIRGASLQFKPDAEGAGGAGDRMRFIQVLWAAVYKPSEARFAEVRAFEAVELTRAGTLDELRQLVGAETVRVLDVADGARALGELIVQAFTTPLSVSADLEALHRLGLVRFVPPAARPSPNRRQGDASGGGTRPRRESGVRRSGRTRARVEGARSGDRPRRTSSTPRRSASARAASASRSSSTRRTSSTRRAANADTNRSSRSRVEGRSGRAHVAARMRSAGRADAVHKRLELEVSRLQGANPAEVLGVPHDAERLLVQKVGGRMLDRYTTISENARYTDETRDLAKQLVAKVNEAVERWGHVQHRAGGDPTTQREQIMLEQGMVLVDAGDFARADRMLTQARDLAMVNPKILAALGWARFNNPDRPADERREEGRDYLLLAEQFDPKDTQTEWLLCKVLRMMGDDQAALRRARRVLSVDPDHADARVAVKELTPAQPT